MDDQRSILGQLPLFQSLSGSELDAVTQGARSCVLEKGQFLFHRDDIPEGFFVVLSGQVKLALISPGGDEKVVEIIGPRTSFGEAVMFLDKPYPVSAVALLPTRCLQIRKSVVDRLLLTDAGFARRMLAGLSMRLHALIHDVEAYSIHSSTQRVIGYLLQQGAEQESEHPTIALPTSKLVIASRLNLTPETLSRVFHELSQQGLIDVRGRNIHIHSLQRLREFLA